MSLMLQLAKTNGIQFAEEDDWESYHALANLTGFNGIDIFSGSVEYDIHGMPRLNGGLFPRAITIVGQSATGKTTLVLRLACAIIDRWNRIHGDLAEFFMKDLEDNTPARRIQDVSNWTDWQMINRVNHSNNVVSIDEIYNELRQIADLKEKNRKALTVKTGIRDMDGKEIEVMSPTIFAIDSVAALSAPGFDDLEFDKDGNLKKIESVAGNIDAMREARANTAFIKKVKSLLSKYNIVLLMINHIIEKPSMGMFDFPTRVLPFLKPGERLKGGNELVYQSFAIINLTYGKKIDDKDPIYGDKIRGSSNSLTFVKSKSNVEGIPVPLVFDQRTGHRPELSDWEYIYNANQYGIGGSPARYFLKILPEVTFTRKGLFDACQENALLARALSFTTRYKMNHDVIARTPAPDVGELFSSLSYEERVALILAYTEDYPGYEALGITLEQNIRDIGLEHRKYIVGDEFHIGEEGNYFFGKELFDALTMKQEEGEPRYIPFVTTFATPFDTVEKGDDGIDYIFTPEEV